jgi:hypothetical protein
VGYCYPSGLEKTLCKWDIYICPAGHVRVKNGVRARVLEGNVLQFTHSRCLPILQNEARQRRRLRIQIPSEGRPLRLSGLQINVYRGSFPGGTEAGGVKSTTHFYLAPRLGMSRGVPVLLLYAFLAGTGVHFYVVFLSSPSFAVSTHPRHQPAATWVNTTRHCKYGQVLLMMGENIAQNI